MINWSSGRAPREAINTPPGLRCSHCGSQHLFSHNIAESRLILPVNVHFRKVDGLTLHGRSLSFLHHLVVSRSVVGVQGQHGVHQVFLLAHSSVFVPGAICEGHVILDVLVLFR